jgi:putative transcriptional regulator
MQSQNLKHQLLIAMPNLDDPNFFHTVTLICDHTEAGAMGIVINRPTDIKAGEVFEQMEIETQHAGTAEAPVFLGGPVEEQRGFVLHSGSKRWDSTLNIAPDVNITTSRDILEAMARGDGPDQSLIALGYAGWGAGQLEQEMLDNAWLTVSANKSILFELPPTQRWEASARLLGVDLALLSGESGHA